MNTATVCLPRASSKRTVSFLSTECSTPCCKSDSSDCSRKPEIPCNKKNVANAVGATSSEEVLSQKLVYCVLITIRRYAVSEQ